MFGTHCLSLVSRKPSLSTYVGTLFRYLPISSLVLATELLATPLKYWPFRASGELGFLFLIKK